MTRLSPLLVGLLLVSACRIPGAVRPSIRIGLVAPFEGRYRAIGYDVIYAVRLALQEANAGGGIAGYSVELAAYDDGADAQQAVLQARKLALDPTVVAVLGHFREGTTAAALDVYVDEGLPLLAAGVVAGASPPASGTAYWLSPSAGELAARLRDELVQAGVRRAALVAADDALTQAFMHLSPAEESAHFVQLVPIHLLRGEDWAVEVARSDVEALVCNADPVRCAEAARALRVVGWQGMIYGGPDLAIGDFVAVAGAAACPCRYATPWPEPGILENSAGFVEAYRSVSNGLTPGPYAMAAYEATWVLLEALERDIAQYGRPSRSGLAAQLARTARHGLLGTITFDNSHTWASGPIYLLRCDPEDAGCT